MKKLFKIGVIVLIIGLIALGIGYFNGGNKTVYLENGRLSFARNRVHHLSTHKQFDRLDISATTADVIIREGKEYQVTYYGNNGHVPTADIHNKVISIRQSGNIPYVLNLNGYRDQDTIVITVPKDKALAGRIHVKSGDLTISNVKLNHADVNVMAGDVNYQQATVNGGKTTLTTGDFEAQDLMVHGHYTVKNQDGDNTVTNTTIDGYYLKTENGDNELNGEDKGTEALSQNDNAENVLRLLNQNGDNEVN